MKKIFSNNRIIVLAFVTVFSISHISAQAEAIKPPSPIELKYIGMIKNNPVFQLNFSAKAADEPFTIEIKDEYGVSLYRENIIGQYFSKKFMLNSEEIGDVVLRFEITRKNTGQITWFEVSPSNRFVQNWVLRTNSDQSEVNKQAIPAIL